MKYFDSHAHIASSPKKYKNISQVIERAKEAGVIKIVDSAIDIQTSKAVLKLHLRFPDLIIPTLGLHPELLIPGADVYVENLDIDSEVEKLKSLYFDNKSKYKAIGECGLDYYWIVNSKKRIANGGKLSIVKHQRLLFKKQIEFAKEVQLPLVVHSRGAEEECLEAVSRQLLAESCKVLFHSFTGDIKIAQKVFEAGYYISFNGIITYPSAESIREIFKFGWEDFRHLILTETDSPYLAPQIKRGEICEPADVRSVVEKMAEISNASLDGIAKVAVINAKKFYNI